MQARQTMAGRWLLAAGLLLVGTAHARGEATPEAVAAEGPDLAHFEAYLDGVMASQLGDHELAGITFALVLDGDLALAKGYGMADLESATPVDAGVHLFRPGSVSKLFTWTAVMQLYERGKLRLDAPVGRYIDQFAMPNDYGDITLEHILTHAVGLEDGGAGYLFAASAEDLMPLADSLAKYKPGQYWAPGVVSAYSNWATSVAGLVVANLSGMRFEDYVDQHIFEPLAMRSSSFHEPLPDGMLENMATGYFSRGKGLERLGYEYIGNFAPAGALAATATDMANFIIAHVNGGEFRGQRILGADTVELMHSPLLVQHAALPAFAHGFYERHRNGQRFLEHGGDTIAFHSMLTIDPQNGFGFFLSYNAPDGALARTAVINAVIDYFYPRPVAAAVAATVGAKQRVAAIGGAYRANRRSQSKLEALSGIVGDIAIVPEGDASLVIANPLVGGVFDEVEPWVFQERHGDARVVFETDDGDRAVRAHFGAAPMMALDKLSWYETGTNHIAVIALAVLTAVFVLINGIRNRGTIRQMRGVDRYASLAAMANALTVLLFVIVMAVSFTGLDFKSLIFDFPPGGVGVALLFPVLGAVLAVAMAVLCARLWQQKAWGLAKRLRYAWVTVVFALYALVLNYWNALGWHYYG